MAKKPPNLNRPYKATTRDKETVQNTSTTKRLSRAMSTGRGSFSMGSLHSKTCRCQSWYVLTQVAVFLLVLALASLPSSSTSGTPHLGFYTFSKCINIQLSAMHKQALPEAWVN